MPKTWRNTTEEESKGRVPRKRRKKTNTKAGEVEGEMKVVEDVRMVYDATSSGLNDAVWAPWFSMPTVEMLLRAVEGGTYMANYDIGEMFLNFMLEPRLRPYAGVDLTPSFPEEVTLETYVVHGCWQRMMMGLSPAPYFTIKDMLIVEKEIRGDRKHRMNVFGWERVVLNLPGSKGYDLTRPWVFKMRADGKIATDFSRTLMTRAQ